VQSAISFSSIKMRVLVLLALIVVSASALRGRKPAAKVPAWACDSKDETTNTGKLGAMLNFAMDDEGSEEQKAAAEKTEDEAIAARKEAIMKKNKATPEEQAAYESAREELIDLTRKMQEAKAKYAVAVEAMLQVPSVDGAAVSATLEKKEQDQLVVFYAPWCPHCQRFVLGNEQGIPDKAPLELLNKELEPHKDTLKVVRFDTQTNGKTIPEGFEVQYIPTIYLAAADGTKHKYDGAPDPAALKAFIKEHATATKM